MKQLALKGKKKKQVTNERRLITLSDTRSPISEQYRTVRTNIQFSSVDSTIKTLMITSAGPSEGKSTTVANLAVVFAQQEKKVLLIDADMRKPTVHYTFQLHNHRGLTNVLTKQTSLLDAINKTDQENLVILTSGPIPPNPAELLASRSMDELLDEALKSFDIILFDTPPVLAVTDAPILANKCDGTILVVNSGRTEMEAALKAKELLMSANAKLLGTVLNQKKAKDSQYYYYYSGN